MMPSSIKIAVHICWMKNSTAGAAKGGVEWAKNAGGGGRCVADAPCIQTHLRNENARLLTFWYFVDPVDTFGQLFFSDARTMTPKRPTFPRSATLGSLEHRASPA